jgi:hypothetical protein
VVDRPAALPPRASRLVVDQPRRLLDTRTTGETSTTVQIPSSAEPSVAEQPGVAVALSVTVMKTTQAGTVTIDGRAGVVEAVAAGGPGAQVTNLVVVPIVGDQLDVRNSAGGAVVVDLVGRLEPVDEPQGAGRLLSTEPVRLVDLVTAVDGGDAVIDFSSAPTARAYLAMVTADVGADGGTVRFGPRLDGLDQMVMWGPSGADRTRRGLVLLRPGDDGRAALRYDGGTTLTLDVVAYVTGDDAAPAVEGLYVPSGPRVLHQGALSPDQPAEIEGLDPPNGLALVTVHDRGETGGRLWSTLAPIGAGRLTIETAAPVSVDVTLLGVFLR